MYSNDFSYEVRESARARSLRITVREDERIVATAPSGTSITTIERFINSRREWIGVTIEKFHKKHDRNVKRGITRIQLPRLRRGTKAHRAAIAATRQLVTARLPEINRAYATPAFPHGFPYGRVSIRSQRTRWGSASSRGALSFNYRIIYLPPALQDYVLAHELAHLGQLNHSPAFWALVAKAAPNWKELRRGLRKYRF